MTTEERLDRLERELRRVRRRNRALSAVGAVALLLMGAAVLTGATTAPGNNNSALNPAFRTMKTHGFAIGDDENESRIVVQAPEGGPELVLLDREASWKAMLGVRTDTQWLTLGAGLRSPIIVSRVGEKGPAIVMADEKYNVTWQAPPADNTPEGSEAEDEQRAEERVREGSER